MAIEKVECYQVICDGCGAQTQGDGYDAHYTSLGEAQNEADNWSWFRGEVDGEETVVCESCQDAVEVIAP